MRPKRPCPPKQACISEDWLSTWISSPFAWIIFNAFTCAVTLPYLNEEAPIPPAEITPPTDKLQLLGTT